jgi:hypothetical protein
MLHWILEALAFLCFLLSACDVKLPKGNLTALGLLAWLVATEVR